MTHSLTIIGLGSGHIDDLTRRAWHALETARVVYLRTTRHPCVPDLPKGAEYRNFDHYYEQHTRFEDVYAAIVETLLNEAERGDMVYAVPGDPTMGEAAVIRLLAEAPARGVRVELVHGLSFIEPILGALNQHGIRVDGMNGLQVFDALDVAALHHPPFHPDAPALLGQVYSRQVASDVKLTLMNEYPDEHEVVLVHAAGTPEVQIERVPLYAMDHSDGIAHLTSLYVPALGGGTLAQKRGFESFQEVIAYLRAPEGCPWDRKQTHLSLRKYLLEETYEVLDALDAEDPDSLQEELGDLLLQIVLHTQIAVDDGEFKMGDVINGINAKLVRRHPHVWPPATGTVEVDGAEQVVANWQQIKAQEKAERGEVASAKSLLDGVPRALPALMQAHEYSAKAAKPGFEWAQIEDVIAKVREEFDEVLAADTPEHQFEEMGDLLFIVANWARWLKIDPEQALRAANAKFARRFRAVEAGAAEQGRTLEGMTLDEMDALWNMAKANGL